MIFLDEQKLPADAIWLEIPSLESRRGAERLKELVNILGEKGAATAIEKAGPYLLSEELTQNLLLAGLEIPADGEIKALSANRWKAGRGFEIPERGQICGISLNAQKERQLVAFVGTRKIESAEEWLKIAAHLFYGDSLKVAVRYTAPRFNQK